VRYPISSTQCLASGSSTPQDAKIHELVGGTNWEVSNWWVARIGKFFAVWLVQVWIFGKLLDAGNAMPLQITGQL
jgi:hypothetical protein